LLGLVDGNPAFLTVPVPRMVVKALNDYNVEVELQAWIRDEREHIVMRSDLREKVFEALTAAGIDMPFETIQVLQAGEPDVS
jgi:small conductance mechanosensitive channel